jgi:hypothetical protein
MSQSKNTGSRPPNRAYKTDRRRASETNPNRLHAAGIAGSVGQPSHSLILEDFKSAALLNAKEAGQILKLAPATLRNWRVQGRGPPWIRLSRRAIRYRIEDITVWLAERIRRSTSEEDHDDADKENRNG